MAHPRIFRIYYSTLFTFLSIVLLALLLITPADAINQALSNNQLYNVFVIAGGYLLTLLLALTIYASRLYTNRTVIAGIPKTWIPVEKGDVRDSVRKMILESLSRNAVIAWNARPRVLDHATRAAQNGQAQVPNINSFQPARTMIKHHKLLHRKRVTTEKDEQGISISPHPPVWGEIAHEGWSSPSSSDLPNLQYITVILELPHLIEAKAVSLAPPDTASPTTPPMPDLRAVELLQRPAAMGLRDYISHLTSLCILSPAIPVTNFLSAYETARFSSQPRTEKEFRELMRLFAEILRSMTPLDPTILDSLDAIESDIDNDASSTTTSEDLTPHSQNRSRSRSRSRSLAYSSAGSSRSGSEGTIRTAPSRRRTIARASTLGPGLSAGPATLKSKKRERPAVERSPSIQSFAQTRRPYAVSQASSNSLRSASGESVIKLSKSSEPGDLPYTLQLDN
jgi:hypothetical protein